MKRKEENKAKMEIGQNFVDFDIFHCDKTFRKIKNQKQFFQLFTITKMLKQIFFNGELEK